MNTITLFQKNAIREAFEAGKLAAMSDTSIWRSAFSAGEKYGNRWLDHASKAPDFLKYIAARKYKDPISFNSWFNMNRNRLSTDVDRDQYELVATEKGIEMKTGKKLITTDAIEEVIRDVFNMPIDELRYNSRRLGHIKRPRFFASYLAYHHCHNSLSDIGYLWGRKHYSTVLHGAKCVYRDTMIYNDDKQTLILLYRALAKNDYDITHFVQDDDMPSRSGCNRTVVKRVNIEI